MKRKVLTILMAVVLLAGVFAGCTGTTDQPAASGSTSGEADSSTTAPSSEASVEAEADDSGISAPGVYPIVQDTVEMSIFRDQSVNVTDYDDNRLTEWMEEQTNVKITWQLVPAADKEQKLNLMLASGEGLADAIMGGVPNPILVDYADQGVLVSITDIIDTQAVNLQEALNKVDGLRDVMTAPDGEIYSMPSISFSIGNQYPRRMWVNQPWLDKLGLAVPTTTDEFADMLRAFRDDDPNGNGTTDIIPMMGSKNGWHDNAERFLMNSFVQFSEGNPYFVNNGVIEAVYNKEEYREGLRYLNMLVKEGLYDPATYTQELTVFKQVFENPDYPRIGAVPSGGPTSFGTADSPRKNDYLAIAPLKGPEGVQIANWEPYTGVTMYPNTFVVTKACENPVIAVKWADRFYTEEAALRVRYGVPDIDFVDADPDGVNVLGEPAEWKAILPWGSPQNSHWSSGVPMLSIDPLRIQDGADANSYPISNDEISMELYKPYAPPLENIMIPMMYDVADSSRMNEIKAILDPYIKEAREKFIVGVLDIEADWDSYVAELEKMDNNELVEIMNKRYSQLMG